MSERAQQADDADATVVLPTPGRKRSAFAPSIERHAAAADLAALGGLNPLVEAANPILAAVPQIRHALRHPDPAGLRARLREQIDGFERSALAAGIPTIDACGIVARIFFRLAGGDCAGVGSAPGDGDWASVGDGDCAAAATGGELRFGCAFGAAAFGAAGADCGAGRAGRTRFGSLLGSRIAVPAGPANITARGPTLSRRQLLTISPSDRTSGLAPCLAKIALRWSPSITIPVKRTSVSSGSAGRLGTARSVGRRVALNNGRSMLVAIRSSTGGFCLCCTARVASDAGTTVATS